MTDLAYPLGLAWVILFVRKLVERFVFRPIGQRLGMKEQVNASTTVSLTTYPDRFLPM
jgi:hypothetical protein